MKKKNGKLGGEIEVFILFGKGKVSLWVLVEEN